ncbi:MAG: glycosyltransferase family 4 protein [Candidatus Acidiferrales bacterium]
MRILIVVDCYYPSTKSSAKLVHDLGVELHRQGSEVFILTPSELVSESISTSMEDNLLVARVKAGRMKGANRALRALQEISLSTNIWRRAKRFLRKNQCDLILFYSPSIFFGPLVRKLKSLWGCPAYLILRDIFPEWAVDAGILRRGLIYRFFRRMETYQYETADLIAVQSPSNLEYFGRAFPRKRFPLTVLYNWTLLNEGDLPHTKWRGRLGLENKFVFVYGGNIGVAQDMDNLLRLAVRLATRTNIHFLLVGSGSEVPRLNKSIAGSGLRNIQVLPAMSQNEYLSMISEFDVGLISLDARLKTHNIPGKLLSYLYWGLPVLASVNPGNDLFDLLERRRAGFCVANGDDESLVTAAHRLADHPELRSAMGKNARQLLEDTFSVKVAAGQILAHLRDAALVRPGGRVLLPGLSSQQGRQTDFVRQS